MKRALYTPFLVCLLTLSACNDNSLPTSGQVEDRCALTLSFQPEGSISLQRANNNPLKTENGDVTAIGVCITGENHTAYQGTSTTRYTFNTNGTAYEGTSIPGNSPSPVTLYLTHVPATIQAFHPNADVTEVSDGSNNYTIPVTHIPAEQTFTVDAETTTGVGTLKCTGAMDYLYGSANDATGDATTITANNPNSTPTIYMHHALAKVVFTIKCDANRVVDNENDYVKSIKLSSSSGSPFLIAGEGTGGTVAGTMQINNGTLSLTSTTNELTFKPNAESDTQLIAAYSDPASTPASTPNGIVACGLVAPLSTVPGNDITITVTLGKKGNDATYDRQYSATATAFNVQWEKGMCYTYNLTLGSTLSTTADAVTWTTITSPSMIEANERGIKNVTDLTNFISAWETNGGLKKKAGSNTEYDYTPYEAYGWYDKNNGGKFTIKLTSSFAITSTTDSWTPIGTENNPLTIPFDGQGWSVALELKAGNTGEGGAMTIGNQKYSGFIGYTQADIMNLSVVTNPQGVSAENNKIESTGAIYAGGLAGYVEGDIINCSVDLCGTSIINANTSANDATMYLGGLVGYCKGNIYNSAVYTTTFSNHTASIHYTQATAGSCVGGLAGKIEGGTVEGGGTVQNCYTHIGALGNAPGTSSTTSINAGWVIGDVTTSGNTFTGNYYIAGTPANCTPNGPTTEITSKDDFTGLCNLLNTAASQNSKWALWGEKLSNGVIEKVVLKR